VQNAPPSNHLASPTSRWRRLSTAPWLVILARLLVGGLFVVAGFSKLLLPHAEVVALMQQYTIIPQTVTPLIATVLPWVELLSGTALLIGFFTTPAAFVVALQLLAFCLLMVVILIMGIEVEDCGCFGQWGWHETPLQVLIRDLVMLALLWPVIRRRQDVWALDAWGATSTSP
jgi:uncharacterized membrane protein YphA (DoxX/SURF4 family)